VADFDDGASPTCAFCGTALPVASDPPPPPSFNFTPFTPTSSGPGITLRRRRGGALGWIITLGTLLIVGLSVGLPIALSKTSLGGGGGGGGNYQVQGHVVPASSAATSRYAYVTAPDISGLDSPVLRRVDLRTRQIVWSSHSLVNANGDPPLIVANSSTVVAIDGTDVYGFAASTGKALWHSSISYAVVSNSQCSNAAGCALLIGPDLIVLEANGTVQSLLVNDGKQLWSHKFNDTPTYLENAGGSAAIVSNVKSSFYDFLVFNPATGAQRSIAPECAADQGNIEVAGSSSAFEISQDGKTLTVIIDGTGGCAVGYRISSGKLLWRTAPDLQNNVIPASLSSQSEVGGPGIVAWTNDVGNNTVVFAVNTSTGRIRELINAGSQNNTNKLDGAVDGTLLLEQAPSYASEQPGIYGISIASGKQLWMDPYRVPANIDWKNQTVVVTARGLVFVSCRGAEGSSMNGSCRLEAADPKTGDIVGTLNVDSLGLLPTADNITTLPNEVLANTDESLAVGFVSSNGDFAGQWPESPSS
jgi:outer membrane protein assembly factor BamB